MSVTRKAPGDRIAPVGMATYRENEVNHCPGCGRTHWYIGRVSAECAFCAAALPLPECRVGPADRPVFFTGGHRTSKELRAL